MTPDRSEDATTFASLALHPGLLRALAGLSYEEPTPIQREAIPLLLQGRDLFGQAATGTGKTAAFAQAEAARRYVRAEFDSALEPETLRLIAGLKAAVPVQAVAPRHEDAPDAAPVVTSSRKLEWFGQWRLLGHMLLMIRPGAHKKREHCGLWYERPVK